MFALYANNIFVYTVVTMKRIGVRTHTHVYNNERVNLVKNSKSLRSCVPIALIDPTKRSLDRRIICIRRCDVAWYFDRIFVNYWHRHETKRREENGRSCYENISVHARRISMHLLAHFTLCPSRTTRGKVLTIYTTVSRKTICYHSYSCKRNRDTCVEQFIDSNLFHGRSAIASVLLCVIIRSFRATSFIVLLRVADLTVTKIRFYLPCN